MKIFTNILLIVSCLLVAYNVTLLDFEKLFEGNSLIALIGIVASICAIAILLIFKISRKIQEKLNR